MALAKREIVLGPEELARVWQDELEGMVTLGIRHGQFRTVDVDELADRFIALVDGYSRRVAVGRPRYEGAPAKRRAPGMPLLIRDDPDDDARAVHPMHET